MEFKVEIKEQYVEVENNQRNIESQLSRSMDLENYKNELVDNSEMRPKAEIKEEFADSCQGYMENQLFTSPNLKDFINKTDEDNSGEKSNKKYVGRTYFYKKLQRSQPPDNRQ
uniref:Uncharacterized protein LOC114340367 n=1 Tax=Diabrotica virgifera virgifera TaxID=50390 RepID=A0A6P7GC71_DIAVI